MKKFTFLCLFLSTAISADDKLQVSGFGTIGTVLVDSDVYGYRKDISQADGTFKDQLDLSTTSILGLQLDYNVDANLDLVYQAVYRDQNKLSLDSATSLAFIRYTPSPAWSYRLGRTSLDLFLLTEYRDVGFAYTWAHTPSEVYGLIPYRYLDGADISFSSNFNELSFRSKIFAGQSESDIATYDQSESVELDNIFGLSLELEKINWSLQARFTQVKLASETQASQDINNGLLFLSQNVPGFEFIWPDVPGTLQRMTINNTSARYLTIGGRYELAQWDFMAEFSIANSNSEVISRLNGGYGSVIYHFNEHSFFASFALTESDNFNMDNLGVSLSALSNIPGGLEVFYGIDSQMNFYASNQSTTSLGWRWNLTEDLALKAQWDYSKIDMKGGTVWLNKNLLYNPKENVNTFFLNLSFIF